MSILERLETKFNIESSSIAFAKSIAEIDKISAELKEIRCEAYNVKEKAKNNFNMLFAGWSDDYSEEKEEEAYQKMTLLRAFIRMTEAEECRAKGVKKRLEGEAQSAAGLEKQYSTAQYGTVKARRNWIKAKNTYPKTDINISNVCDKFSQATRIEALAENAWAIALQRESEATE